MTTRVGQNSVLLGGTLLADRTPWAQGGLNTVSNTIALTLLGCNTVEILPMFKLQQKMYAVIYEWSCVQQNFFTALDKCLTVIYEWPWNFLLEVTQRFTFSETSAPIRERLLNDSTTLISGIIKKISLLN